MKTRGGLKNSPKDSLSDSMREKRRTQAYKWLDAILDCEVKIVVDSTMMNLMLEFNNTLYWKDLNFDQEAWKKRLRFLRVQLKKIDCDIKGFDDDVLQLVDTSGERKVAPGTTVPDLKLI
ncbi:MAG: hypothetical protein JRC66_06700 [Deltaproteobacteria bacterium]|nr:hypothetical protein [Deltaproteobacteria bacterium]